MYPQKHVLEYLQRIISQAKSSGKTKEETERLYPGNYGPHYLPHWNDLLSKSFDES